MSDIVSNFLERAEKHKGDPQLQAALTAEFALEVRPEPERTALRAALDAAAVLHWFDAGLLEKMLEVSADQALKRRLDALKVLPFVERYRQRRGELQSELCNVHEATRLGWRRQMARENPEGFRGLSLRAAQCFAGNPTPVEQIEHVYHLLCGDPEQGASELLELDRKWMAAGTNPENLYALAAVLRELEETGVTHGRARAATLLAIGEARSMRGETAQLAELASEALRLAQESADLRLESDAQNLVGDVLQSLGQLKPAETAYKVFLAISRRLAEQDPDDAQRQHDLAVAHGSIGDVLQSQGQLKPAEAAYKDFLGISRKLAEQDPSNAQWQHDLAVAHSSIGDVLLAQVQLKPAEEAFGEYLTVSRRLAARYPENAVFQRGLAVAYNRIGDVLQSQGQLKPAEAAYKDFLAISRKLAEQDPSNAQWQHDLAVAHGRVGNMLLAQGQHREAEAAFSETLSISRRLAEQDPSNPGWQRDLAVAHSKVADALEGQGQLKAAEEAYARYLTISRTLAELDQSNALWQGDLARAQDSVARLEAKMARARLEGPAAFRN
jgi:tetratricopeptide (TPR) repeat protein